MLSIMKRPGWRVTSLAAAGLIGLSVLGIAASQELFADRRVAPITEEQARRDLDHLVQTGRPFNFLEESIPQDAGEPTIVGAYRLVPFGFVGDLPVTQPIIPEGSRTDDADTIRQSSLYREPVRSLIPGELSLVVLDTMEGHSESVVRWLYEDVDGLRSIEIIRQRRGPPINISMQPADSERELRIVSQGNYDVVVEEGMPVPQSGNESGKSFVIARTFVDGIEAWVFSRYYSADTLIPIAVSLVGANPE